MNYKVTNCFVQSKYLLNRNVEHPLITLFNLSAENLARLNVKITRQEKQLKIKTNSKC